MMVRVDFTGRRYSIGSALPTELEVSDGSSVTTAIDQLNSMLGESQRLPASCLIAVSGEHIGTVEQHQQRVLRDGDELLLIAPVAGG